jgi:hypothetical protein
MLCSSQPAPVPAYLRIPDEAVQVDGLEGRLAGELDAHHNHPGHPEEEDVVPRLQNLGRVEPLQVGGGLVGPPKGAERPEATGRETDKTRQVPDSESLHRTTEGRVQLCVHPGSYMKRWRARNVLVRLGPP